MHHWQTITEIVGGVHTDQACIAIRIIAGCSDTQVDPGLKKNRNKKYDDDSEIRTRALSDQMRLMT